MKSTRWLGLILICIGIGVGLLVQRSGTSTAQAPKRLPELYGTVVSVRTDKDAKRTYQQFLVRCQKPPKGMPESEQNKHHRSLDEPHVWVFPHADGKIVRRDGKAATISVGQTVSAWCSGLTALDNPPHRGADWVIVEAEAKSRQANQE
jgi:hypothetical protein